MTASSLSARRWALTAASADVRWRGDDPGTIARVGARRRLAPTLCLFVLVVACRGRAPRPFAAVDAGARRPPPPAAASSRAPVPPGSLLAPRATFDASLVYLRRPALVADAALAGLAAQAGFHPAADAGARGRVYRLRSSLDLDTPVMNADEMAVFARTLAPADLRAIGASRWETTLHFEYDAADARASLRAAGALLATAAGRFDAAVYDAQTRQVFTAAAWRTRLATPAAVIASAETVVHLYANGGRYRAVSLGMARFGLPDVAADDVDGPDMQGMGRLVGATVAALVADPVVGPAGAVAVPNTAHADGGAGSVPVRLVRAAPEPGDANNRLVAIEPADPPGASPQARQRALLAGFGDAPAVVMGASPDDEALRAASERARAQIPRLRALVQGGLPDGATLRVKAPFRTASGENEFMWVLVRSWSGGALRGTLLDAPLDVPSLRAGEDVTVREADFYDYYLEGPEGGVDGNETSALLRRRQGG